MHAETTSDVTRQLNSSHGSFELVLSPVLLALVGWWIDTKVGTTPLLVVIGAVLGVVGATIKVVSEYRLKMAAESARRPGVRGVSGTGTGAGSSSEVAA